jgi:peptide chain release factor 1
VLEQLEAIYGRFKEVELLISSPDTMADMKRYTKLNKEYSDLREVVEAYKKYKLLVENKSNAEEILKNETDAELKEMAKMELEEIEEQIVPLEEEIKILMLPKDPEDSKNAMMEIRSGAGGDEASLFVGDVYRMYQKYIDKKGWKLEPVEVMEGTVGGFNKIVFNVLGKDAYGTMKYESGVHRVQRVPSTESQGRVHTSAISVVVLPEAEEFDVEIKDSDLRVDSYCSSGPGGQSVNTTYSAIRITHIPTGVVAQCQDQKSKLKNHEQAMKVLRSRIYEMEYNKYLEEVSSKRKTMVSTGDRSAKIRTYNFPQSRLTDHRIGLTLYSLSAIMDGDLEEVIDKLQMAENAERMKEGAV